MFRTPPVRWTCTAPGHWVTDDSRVLAKTTRMREGALHSSELMWFTSVNGAWLCNAATLSEAKKAVEVYVRPDEVRSAIQRRIHLLAKLGTELADAEAVHARGSLADIDANYHAAAIYAVHL